VLLVAIGPLTIIVVYITIVLEIVVWLLTSNLIAPNRNGGCGLRFHLKLGVFISVKFRVSRPIQLQFSAEVRFNSSQVIADHS
jgi:hypothetical protein